LNITITITAKLDTAERCNYG